MVAQNCETIAARWVGLDRAGRPASRSASVTEPSHGPRKKFLRWYLGANDANTPEARTVEVDCLRLVDEAFHICALDADGELLDLLESFEGKDSRQRRQGACADRAALARGWPAGQGGSRLRLSRGCTRRQLPIASVICVTSSARMGRAPRASMTVLAPKSQPQVRDRRFGYWN